MDNKAWSKHGEKSKKRKGDHNKKWKKDKRKHRESRTSDESVDMNRYEWVEKTPNIVQSEIKEKKDERKSPLERDEWMCFNNISPCLSSDDIRKSKKKQKEEHSKRISLDDLGQSSRELNPYWKNGGNGLPEINKSTSGKNMNQKYKQEYCGTSLSINKSSEESKEVSPESNSEEHILLTEEQMNQIGAKMVKAEIMGKKELAAALKIKLEKARELRQQIMANKDNENVVIITKRDNYGTTTQDQFKSMETIKEHKAMLKSLDACHLCIDSQHMQKHLIVTMGSKIYLSLPSFSSLVMGHCILAPITHIPCQMQLDEDYHEELNVFKKCLVRMYGEQNKVPIFFEVYKNCNKHPHMQVECIPLSQKKASMAPMYFKKALLECESEWASNKKVIDLGQKSLQKVIPKGLAYFAVNFGTDAGFAHVIEDEKLFPRNFAQEIIGGMLDLHHSLWRKPQRENFDQQSEKVMQFINEWNKYDTLGS